MYKMAAPGVLPIQPKAVVLWALLCCGIPTHCEVDKAQGGQVGGAAYSLALERGIASCSDW